MRDGGSVVFFHAHPDDESIFTGGTLRLLADRGVRTVVVLATQGEAGAATDCGGSLGAIRAAEAQRACDLLGVEAVRFLDYGDSGSGHHAELSMASMEDVASDLALILREEQAWAVVTYDEGGIYALPDHLAVHQAGVRAAELAGITTVYEATVDREYLHFVETHLVGHAVEWLIGDDEVTSALNRAPLGVPTVMVSTTVDARSVIDHKRSAMLAHTSQIPVGSSLHEMDDDTFCAVYGYEWFVRRGPATALDDLGF